jgi:hypothetical protein
VDTEHHLIVTHEVTNSGSDRAQLANMAKQAKAVLKTKLWPIDPCLASRQRCPSQTRQVQSRRAASESRTLSTRRRRTSIAARWGAITLSLYNEEDGKMLRRYRITACPNCALKSQCTTGPERRITRWENELLEAVQQHLDANPKAMRQRRETVEHPFGTLKARMGATHSSPEPFRRSPRRWHSPSWLTT